MRGAAVGRSRSWSRGLGLLMILLVFAAAGLNAVGLLREKQAVGRAHPVQDGRLQVGGLREETVVLRDRRGVPHVEAQSERDAWFALGFVHAQDRPSQMLWWARAARGRLAEVVGPDALAADRRARVLGIGWHAESAWETLPRASRRVLEAYAEGVNARFARIRSGEIGMPRALARSRMPLEPWAPIDSLALLKLYAWALGGSLEESLVLSDLIERFGGFDARVFFPEGAGLGALPPVIESVDTDALPPVAALPGFGADGSGAATTSQPLRRITGLFGASIGSSALVVGGAHSRSGRPLLAADAHFEPTIPGAYYEAHLRGGRLDVAGAGLPGIPVFWTGFNRHVAWSAVHARAVVSDLYVETLHPSRPDRYHDGRRWRSLRERVEEIAVLGAATERLSVRETRRGPLVNPLLGTPREPLSLRWTGAVPGSGIAAMLRVAHAENALELRRALALHHEPVLAVAYADTAGEGGVQVAGYIPDRGHPTGLLPVPGRDAAYRWRGRIPHASLPAAQIEAGAGVVVAGDGPLPATAEAAPLEWLWRPGDRSGRAEALLGAAVAGETIDLRRLAELQDDARSGRARDLIGAALAVGAPFDGLAAEARTVVDLLRAWDGSTESDSVGAAVYHVFLDRLLRELFATRLGEPLLARYLGLGRVSPVQLADRVVARAGSRGQTDLWSRPEIVREAVRRSLRQTGLRLSVELGSNRERWTWGRLHGLRFATLWPENGAAASLGPFAYGGDGSSLRAAGYTPLESFAARSVSTYRLLIDTAALDEALTAFAPGQSEHPGHPHRTDALPAWLDGRPALLATSILAVEEGAVSRLVIEPAP